MKKILLTCLMLIASVPLWAHDFEVDGIYYNYLDKTDKTVEVTYLGSYVSEYDEYSGSVTIPSSVTYNGSTYSVTSIGTYAFCSCSGLTEVTIPNSVTSIGTYAFRSCTGLTEVTIPNSVTSIGSYAFEDCTGLTSITIPNSVTSIGSGAFNGTAWYDNQADGVIYINNVLYKYKGTIPEGTSISIKDGTVSISPSAFFKFDSRSGLTSVTIPNSVTSIGDKAFQYCENLKLVINLSNLTFSKGSSNNGYIAYYADRVVNAPNCSIDGDFAWSKANNTNTLVAYLGNDTEVILPTDCNGENYTIGDYAFEDCTGLTSITIGNSVTSIGDRTFYNCTGLTSVTIGNSVTSIGAEAFYYCDRIAVVNSHNTTAPHGAPFEKVVKQSAILNVPSSALASYQSTDGWKDFANICEMAINGYYDFDVDGIYYRIISLTDLTVEVVAKDDTYNSYTGDVVIPETVSYRNREFNVISIGAMAFSRCSGLTSLTIPQTVSTIGQLAFDGCSGLYSITIRDGKTFLTTNGSFNSLPIKSWYLGRNTDVEFNNTVKMVTFAGGVTSIAESAFQGFSSLISVTIGNSVTSIGAGAFNGCTGLTEITIPNLVTKIGTSAFEGCTGLTEVNISDLSAWCKIDFGNDSANPLNYSKKLNLNGTEITELVIPNDITEIKSNTFNGCSGLTKVTIPNSVTSIGSDTFSGCTGLTKLVLEDGTEQISELSFPDSPIETLYWGRNTPKLFMQGNTTLKELTIGKFVTKIKDYMFKNCTDLTSIAMSNSITEIGASAFNGCTSLISITIPGSVTTIGESAFMNCNALTQVELSEGVTTVGASAFNGCTSLASIAIPGSVTTIGGSVFSGCTALVDVIFKNGKDAIDMRGNTFKENPLVSLYIGRTMTNVKSPFNGIITLEKVTLGSGMTSLQSDAFVGCKGIKELIIEGGEGAIAIDCKFNDSTIEKLHIGRNGTYAFNNRIELKEVSVGDNVTILPNNAFNGCSNITTLKLGKKLEKIGSGAFTGCATLMNVYSTNLTPPTGAVFENKTYLQGTLYVVKGSKAAYEAADGWKEFWEIVDNLPFEVNGIWYNIDENGNANVVGNPSGDSYMGEFTIPASVEIDGVTYPVTSIDAEAFANAINVTSITIEDSNQPLTIGAPATAIVAMSNDQAGTFEACMLDSVYVGRNLNYATAPFANISSLKKVAVGALVTSMGGAMFAGCENIETVYALSAIPATDAEFESRVYDHATLVVPVGAVAYTTTDGWKEFVNVITTESSMVEDINIGAVTGNVSIIAVNGEIVVKGAEDAQIAVYNINGGLIYHGLNRPVVVANKGVYVVVVNGIAMKVML